jgi:hypothetical protein
MKRQSIHTLFVIMAVIVFNLGLPKTYADIGYDDGIYNIYDGEDIVIQSGNGVVNVYGGTRALIFNDAGYTINAYGGSTRWWSCNGGSQNNVYGGYIDTIKMDSAVLNIYGGVVGGLDLRSGAVNIYGGYISGDIYSGHITSSAAINIDGGIIDGDILLNMAAPINIYSGYILGDLFLVSTDADIFGGHILGSLYPVAFSQITIYGSGFNYPFGILTGSGILTGTLANGDLINCSFNTFYNPDNPDDLESNGTIFLVPVPGAVLLSAIGLAVSGWRLRRKMAL